MKTCLINLRPGDIVQYLRLGSITPQIVYFQYWEIYPSRMVGTVSGRCILFHIEEMKISKIIKKKNGRYSSQLQPL